MKSDFTNMRLRTTPDVRSTIIRAAERSGLSISKFVVQAAVERAARIIDAHDDHSTLAEMNTKFFAALDEEDRKQREKSETETELTD